MLEEVGGSGGGGGAFTRGGTVVGRGQGGGGCGEGCSTDSMGPTFKGSRGESEEAAGAVIVDGRGGRVCVVPFCCTL